MKLTEAGISGDQCLPWTNQPLVCFVFFLLYSYWFLGGIIRRLEMDRAEVLPGHTRYPDFVDHDKVPSQLARHLFGRRVPECNSRGQNQTERKTNEE